MGCQESDTAEQLNWTESWNFMYNSRCHLNRKHSLRRIYKNNLFSPKWLKKCSYNNLGNNSHKKTAGLVWNQILQSLTALVTNMFTFHKHQAFPTTSFFLSSDTLHTASHPAPPTPFVAGGDLFCVRDLTPHPCLFTKDLTIPLFLLIIFS